MRSGWGFLRGMALRDLEQNHRRDGVAGGLEPPITSIRTGRALRGSVGHLSAAFCCSSSVQQSGLRETVGEPLGILFPLEGQPAQMFAERVFRIDLHELAPNATGLVHLVEMTESGRERGP
jgi:hypothetical protein